ncbi:MAG: hypothetical protein NZ772_09715 [Cyanobacteria bacterium]|nr:hypothetical protein [Cyanobacteriota bacterium]MDW8201767.1 hypothetical protein [Cyanobacteriota bacterium SKYGB_h_bin112]
MESPSPCLGEGFGEGYQVGCTRWNFSQSLKSSLWIGGLGTILTQVAMWMFYGDAAYSGGGIVIALDTGHLGLIAI